MIINKSTLDQNFKVYDKEVVAEIIDIFFDEYPERIANLEKAINEEDFDSLKTVAHGIKGIIANFHAEEPRELAKQLEHKGADKDISDTPAILEKLKDKTEQMMEELKQIKKEYQ